MAIELSNVDSGVSHGASSSSEVHVRENPFVENPVENVVVGSFNLFGHVD
jgi:hypothetical protein